MPPIARPAGLKARAVVEWGKVKLVLITLCWSGWIWTALFFGMLGVVLLVQRSRREPRGFDVLSETPSE